jgi:hypothetical protein
MMFYLNFPSPGIIGMRQGMGSDGGFRRPLRKDTIKSKFLHDIIKMVMTGFLAAAICYRPEE